MNKLNKGDEIVVIAGKDKGRRSTITQLIGSDKVLVQGVNTAKKHQKGNPNAGVTGGIIEKDMPLNISNVMLVNPATGKGDRVGIKESDDGKKVRFFKSNGEIVGA